VAGPHTQSVFVSWYSRESRRAPRDPVVLAESRWFLEGVRQIGGRMASISQVSTICERGRSLSQVEESPVIHLNFGMLPKRGESAPPYVPLSWYPSNTRKPNPLSPRSRPSSKKNSIAVNSAKPQGISKSSEKRRLFQGGPRSGPGAEHIYKFDYYLRRFPSKLGNLSPDTTALHSRSWTASWGCTVLKDPVAPRYSYSLSAYSMSRLHSHDDDDHYLHRRHWYQRPSAQYRRRSLAYPLYRSRLRRQKILEEPAGHGTVAEERRVLKRAGGWPRMRGLEGGR
jgi:hypothetical protein